MILIIDNYDSFTYNLVQYVNILNIENKIIIRDKLTLELINQIKPTSIMISPGPGNTKDCDIIKKIIHDYYQLIPIIGICLGHQIIANAFGSNIIKAPMPMHGKISKIRHSQSGIFTNLPNPLKVTRYHSLIIDKVPDDFIITATTNDGIIMAIEHKSLPIYGVQFHPEAYLTECGLTLLENFVRINENNKD